VVQDFLANFTPRANNSRGLSVALQTLAANIAVDQSSTPGWVLAVRDLSFSGLQRQPSIALSKLAAGVIF
jgi:hypothetical protein